MHHPLKPPSYCLFPMFQIFLTLFEVHRHIIPHCSIIWLTSWVSNLKLHRNILIYFKMCCWFYKKIKNVTHVTNIQQQLTQTINLASYFFQLCFDFIKICFCLFLKVNEHHKQSLYIRKIIITLFKDS